MRRHLDREEPDSNWTDSEIMVWVTKYEAGNHGSSKEQQRNSTEETKDSGSKSGVCRDTGLIFSGQTKRTETDGF